MCKLHACVLHYTCFILIRVGPRDLGPPGPVQHFRTVFGVGFGLGLGLVLAVAARESAFKRIEIYCLLLKYRSNVFFSLCYGNVIASWVRGNKIVTCALHTCWQDPCFPFSKFYLK